MENDNTANGAVPLGLSSKGAAKFRPERVQTEIDRVLDMPINNAFSLAATGSLLPQTMVHLLRNFPVKRSPLYQATFCAFLGRVERSADRLLSGLPDNWRERGREMAIDNVLEKFSKDDLDYFEMSYADAMKRICIDVFRNLAQRMRTELPTEDFANPDDETSGEEAVDAIVYRAGAPMPEAEARAQLTSILATLTDREREVWLCIEYAEMSEDEVALKLGCVSRNVRHILKRARDKLHAEGQRNDQ